MKHFAILLIFAWLVTTNQISDVTDMNGKYAVTYKTYCSTTAPVYKTNGDLTLKDDNQEITLRTNVYTVQLVARCP